MSDMECPSAERLSSNEMTADERGAWLDHAAGCPQCRAIALVMSHGDLPGPPAHHEERIGRFVIVREIGRGAMGVVYAATDPELARPIAIKVLHEAGAVERLRREARALARLDHPNVVRVYDVGVEGERAFVAMELIEGENMRRWLASAPRSQREIIDVLAQAARGLAAAHAAGIVHRDFKPDNVLVGPGRVVVGDFGLSSLVNEPVRGGPSDVDHPSSEDKLTVTGAVIGTPAYMAPEQAVGDATTASDQFAFCVAAWEALLGVRPFTGTTLREVRAQAAANLVIRPVAKTLPRRIERALRRGLAANSADRFGSMDALLAALVPLRRRWPLIAAAVAVAVALAAVVWRTQATNAGDPCDRIGNAIAESWTLGARARVRAASGDATVTELDRYAAEWRTARTALCRAPKTTDPDELARRAAREACYERGRVELARKIADPSPTSLTRDRVVPLAACEDGVALSEAPGTASDPRGCGCPYSPCTEADDRCTGECNARAFRLAGPVPGVAVDGRQEAVCGATPDGASLLYLAGSRCALDHLYLAQRVAGRYESIDLTPQLAAHGVRIGEGCCTLARDGRAVVVESAHAAGFVRFPLDGTQLGAPDASEFAGLIPEPTGDERLVMPILSGDERTLYFTLSGTTTRSGPYEAKRTDASQPFPAAVKLTGRATQYEYTTGISDDEKTMFMASEYATRVLVRESRDQPYGDLQPTIPPSRLPGWRAIPIESCRRLVTTMTPGGCESEQAVFLEAVGP